METPATLRNEMENGQYERILEVLHRLSTKSRYPWEPSEELKRVAEKMELAKAATEAEEFNWVVSMVGPIDGSA